MKYILKKEYPGSPKLGYIVTKGTLNWSQLKDYPEFWEEIIEYPIDTKVFNEQTKAIYIKKEDGWYKTSDKTAYTDEMITKSNHINIIKDKVIEKDYKILSFKHLNNDLIYDEYQEIYRNETSTRPIGYCLEFYKIHSVKRLSDSEIFTIDDKVIDGNIINEFELIDNKLKVWTVHPSYTIPIKPKDNGSITGCGNMSFNWLNNIKKFKQKLFTTEQRSEIEEIIKNIIK